MGKGSPDIPEVEKTPVAPVSPVAAGKGTESVYSAGVDEKRRLKRAFGNDDTILTRGMTESGGVAPGGSRLGD